MKLHAQNQLYISFTLRDLKVLIASLGMPDPIHVKLRQFIASCNRFIPVSKKSTLHVQ